MASGPFSLPTKAYFPPFQYAETLDSLGEKLESTDLEKGPYGLTSLGQKNLKEFIDLCKEFEILSHTSEDLLERQKLRTIQSQVQEGIDIREVTSKAQSCVNNLSIEMWYSSTATKLASENFWKHLSCPRANQKDIHALQIEWLLHAEWAHLTSQQLIKARQLLQRMKAYVQDAQKELEWSLYNIRIPVPNLPLIGEIRPICGSVSFPKFREKYQNYLSHLMTKISLKNKSLAEAMQARLELTCRSEGQSDDTLYDCVKRIEELTKSNSIFGTLPKEPRRTLDPDNFQIFHQHILEVNDPVLLRRLYNLKYLNTKAGIPCRPVIESSELILMCPHTHSPIRLPSTIHLYGLACYNMAMHNIQAEEKFLESPKATLNPQRKEK
ncbi:MAG TPA: hypothetical protein VHA52_03840, partial [Candidatus Babeliaceae bacterium]|nr:hypothetical protein [Candidatus Babeliaceae bacterium]